MKVETVLIVLLWAVEEGRTSLHRGFLCLAEGTDTYAFLPGTSSIVWEGKVASPLHCSQDWITGRTPGLPYECKLWHVP